VTDETPNPPAPDAPPDAGTDAQPGDGQDSLPGTLPPGVARPPSAADVRAHRPEYKGAELDPERGPGLGCFWFQLIVLGFFIVLIPIGLQLGWPFELLAILLFVVIGLLLLTGQSVIFLLRLVAADRRAQGRRRPLASPTKTVGELEDEHRVAHAVGGARPAGATDATSTEAAAEPPAVAVPPGDAAEPPAGAEPPAAAGQPGDAAMTPVDVTEPVADVAEPVPGAAADPAVDPPAPAALESPADGPETGSDAEGTVPDQDEAGSDQGEPGSPDQDPGEPDPGVRQ
jgi:hypothetical protein